jgi:hypothetical protein
VVPVRGGEELLRRVFEPLGYTVSARRIPLDEQSPEWGEGRHFEVHLAATCRLSDLLGHLYVLIPVLDAGKHYWFGPSRPPSVPPIGPARRTSAVAEFEHIAAAYPVFRITKGNG